MPVRSRRDDPDGLGLAGIVANRVLRLRMEREWSLSALAARAGIGKATLSQIEAGQRNPTLETLYAVAAALEVPLAALIAPGPGATTAHSRPAAAPVKGAAVVAHLLEVFEDPGLTSELYRVVIRPGRRQFSPAHGVAVTEHLVLGSGKALVGPVGAPLEVEAGGYASWTCQTEHIYQALSDADAEGTLLIRHQRPQRRR